MAEHLQGGRDQISKEKNIVVRPSHEWTPYVHGFLGFLHRHEFSKVPYPYGINENGQEMVSFVEGEVFNEELPQEVRSDEVLISFAQLIRNFHDLGAEYIKRLNGNENWMLPVQTEVETMCHGDLAPYNTVLKGKEVVGLIDFDTLHPGSRLWDIAYALYRWIPLMSDENPENFGSRLDKLRRTELFFSTYGMTEIVNKEVFELVIRRLEYLVSFMKQEADKGDPVIKQHIDDGHLRGYLKDIEYIREEWVNRNNNFHTDQFWKEK